MKYLVIVESGDGDYSDIEEFDGTLEEATYFFTRRAFYGGEDNPFPGDYEEVIWHDINKIIVVLASEVAYGDVKKIESEHRAWWEQQQEKEKEDKDLEEYERLKAKYG